MTQQTAQTYECIDHERGICLVEITRDGIPAAEQPPKRYYVVYETGDSSPGQIESCIPADNPTGGRWVAKWSVGGVKCVAKARTRATARRWYRRMCQEAAEFAE